MSRVQGDNLALLSLKAMFDTMPLSIAVIPWGILTGAITIQIGLTPWQGQLMSLLVFAGAAQLSGMTMMASSSPLLAICGSTFVISARHLLYSVTFREHVLGLSRRWRIAIAFVLTDEMFAISQAHTKKSGGFSAVYALVSGVTFYVVWNIATLIGIVAGELFEDLDSFGLDFAIIATFIAMTFEDLRKFPIAIAVLISGVLSVSLKPFFVDSHIIIAAVFGMVCAYYSDSVNKSCDKPLEENQVSK